ncbi:hypothetical protein PH210_07845 [Paenibacillus sp. BSR1-1]|uniref:hypothetical protein n=1 Tax=Paenibacillus sp. BSR1-1 TaxID=3020845 RepID=UPI0025B1389E|nr:hypothetical protein [Paenibacillus sp. BSR1-1]MDN3016120.1 hypothetical protein [Paenibacillus sp. BSR1-1]
MATPNGFIQEILGISFRARHKRNQEPKNSFENPIIHKQINGEKVYHPLNRSLWNE